MTTLGTASRAVLITASEPEPRTFGKQVVIGGLLDHLCRRLGPDQVHVVLVSGSAAVRPTTAYRIHVLRKPTASSQLTGAARPRPAAAAHLAPGGRAVVDQAA